MVGESHAAESLPHPDGHPQIALGQRGSLLQQPVGRQPGRERLGVAQRVLLRLHVPGVHEGLHQAEVPGGRLAGRRLQRVVVLHETTVAPSKVRNKPQVWAKSN